MSAIEPADNLPRIVIQKNGPYEVYGNIPLKIQTILANEAGRSWEWGEGETLDTKSEYWLCRCGHSSHKPFCDDSHLKFGFDGTETAGHIPFDSLVKRVDGPTLEMGDVGSLCANARFCSAAGKIQNLIPKSDDPAIRELVIREVMNCPAGRLTLKDKTTNQAIEQALQPTIGIVEDIPMNCSGPLWVQGGITIKSSDGVEYEVRNRVTLCRCGASRNKPFCDGSHNRVNFNDGLFD
jgi:CDGSH-type Zn-finger protein